VGFLIAFLALFLLVLAGVSFAAVKLFAPRDANGNITPPGCLLGCATALALTVIALLALAAFVAGSAAIVKLHALDRLIQHAPDVEIRSWMDPERHVHRDPARPLHVVVEWSGHSQPTSEIISRIDELVHARVRVDGQGVEGRGWDGADESDVLVDVDYTQDENGAPITVVDIAIPIHGGPLEGLEEALDDLLNQDGEGVRVRIQREVGELR
jgi:hypothetical protein